MPHDCNAPRVPTSKPAGRDLDVPGRCARRCHSFTVTATCARRRLRFRFDPGTLVTHFLAGLPLWASVLIVVVLPTSVAMCAPVLIRRRVALERLTVNNEVAGFKFAAVAVLYAVLVGFAIIMAWERFADGEATVAQEAGAAATLYRLAADAGPEAIAVRRAVDNYLELAIKQEWPQMALEGRSAEVTRALDRVYAAAVRFAQSGSQPNPVLVEIFHQIDVLTDARQNLIHLAIGIIPGMMWVVLVTGACLTVGFAFFFGTENLSAQVLMTGILSLVVFMSLWVIISVNYPLTGPVHIDSEPLRGVLQEFAHR
jgi:Protein of unknown function (DUF4239)